MVKKMTATIFILYVYFCYPGIGCKDDDPRSIEDYFINQNLCNSVGANKTRNEKFMVWECRPYNAG